jgi:hypothetical protein
MSGELTYSGIFGVFGLKEYIIYWGWSSLGNLKILANSFFFSASKSFFLNSNRPQRLID